MDLDNSTLLFFLSENETLAYLNFVTVGINDRFMLAPSAYVLMPFIYCYLEFYYLLFFSVSFLI